MRNFRRRLPVVHVDEPRQLVVGAVELRDRIRVVAVGAPLEPSGALVAHRCDAARRVTDALQAVQAVEGDGQAVHRTSRPRGGIGDGHDHALTGNDDGEHLVPRFAGAIERRVVVVWMISSVTSISRPRFLKQPALTCPRPSRVLHLGGTDRNHRGGGNAHNHHAGRVLSIKNLRPS